MHTGLAYPVVEDAFCNVGLKGPGDRLAVVFSDALEKLAS